MWNLINAMWLSISSNASGLTAIYYCFGEGKMFDMQIRDAV